jgi:hypothetical protein
MLDAEAILRAKSAVSRPRSGLISFLVGNVDEGSRDATGEAPSPGSLAPPSFEVRREMVRLELAARLAELEAEAAEFEAIVGEAVAPPATGTPPPPDANGTNDTPVVAGNVSAEAPAAPGEDLEEQVAE